MGTLMASPAAAMVWAAQIKLLVWYYVGFVILFICLFVYFWLCGGFVCLSRVCFFWCVCVFMLAGCFFSPLIHIDGHLYPNSIAWRMLVVPALELGHAKRPFGS